MRRIALFVIAAFVLLAQRTNWREAAAQEPKRADAAAKRAKDAVARWWPLQALPKGLVIAKSSGHGAEDFLLQSLAGLAAKAVNEGRGDEMVWVATGNADEEDWLARLRNDHPEIELRGTLNAWELVERYARRGWIKGYLLYRADASAGQLNEHRSRMDRSVNVASSLAGILDGAIVDQSIEKLARQHGLALLLDVREKTQAWCFEHYRDQFNRRIVCMQDPRKPHARDLAIAHKALTIYGDDDPAPAVMKWLEPLSPVIGWNGGDEFQTTRASSLEGQFQTASDWCMNLPVLMAGSHQDRPARISNFDPRTIDWKDQRSAVSFVSTDGDNIQFFEGSFFRAWGTGGYWSSPARGKMPFGWSACFAHLVQICPQAVEYAAQTQSVNDSFIEWGGGYYYPDLFAKSRTNRWELLAEQARRTWSLMKFSNTRIIGFNVVKFDSPETRKACEVMAAQMDGLEGILLFQYDPYEAGAGERFWVKDAKGVAIPVISARYAIWEHANQRPRAGTPAKVAREIRQAVESATPAHPRYDWVIVHVWSWFKEAAGNDENAENIPQKQAARGGAVRGLPPALWCSQRLGDSIRTISPAEMIWRVRMEHDSEGTKRAIEQWRP